MRPKESKDDKSPVTLPWPTLERFVSKAETAGRMKPFPIPKIVKKIAAVTKVSINKISPKPKADIKIPSRITNASPNQQVNTPTRQPRTNEIGTANRRE